MTSSSTGFGYTRTFQPLRTLQPAQRLEPERRAPDTRHSQCALRSGTDGS